MMSENLSAGRPTVCVCPGAKNSFWHPNRHTHTQTHTHTHKAKTIHPRYAGCKNSHYQSCKIDINKWIKCCLLNSQKWFTFIIYMNMSWIKTHSGLPLLFNLYYSVYDFTSVKTCALVMCFYNKQTYLLSCFSRQVYLRLNGVCVCRRIVQTCRRRTLSLYKWRS